MGHGYEAACRDCGHRFHANEGGGFSFHLLHCDTCGTEKDLSFEEIGEPHLRYLKGLEGPYCLASSEHDRRVRESYPGAPLPEEEYQRAVESIAGPCDCGGRFRFGAPVRCPQCRSTTITDMGSLICYD
jgi:predicted Zn-ribbon and HTH transcriptional regulator